MSEERYTHDPVPAEQLEGDVARLLEVLDDGGVGIVPLDVAYAVNATTERGIRRIFDAKRRSYDKPSGLFANATMSREIHVMDDARHDLVETIIREENIPFSVVAPFRVDHPFFANIEEEVREACAIGFDYGTSKYINDEGRSSTIIDFRDFSVIRVGVVFDRVAEAFRRHGGVELKVG